MILLGESVLLPVRLALFEALLTEEVALGVPIAPAVADTGLVVPTVVVEVELTSEPVPQGIADPSG